MGNSIKPDGDISKLHPAIREKVLAIREALQSEGIPFDVFEAFRTPERQAQLYAKGRTKPGRKVTWVKPWRSIHQYGLAVDFVLKDEKDNWSWKTDDGKLKWWHRMHEIAKQHDMTPLYNKNGDLIELPHIQLRSVNSKELHKGNYPEGGDAIWADHLSELIDNWKGTPAAPPMPMIDVNAVALDPDLVASMEKEEDNGVSPLSDAHDRDLRFQKLHTFIKDAEGGFVNHKDDKGGATNFGVTIATLKEWRGTEVTAQDVAQMSADEAEAILYTNYYIKCKCDQFADRVAMVVYNMAVHSGRGAAQRTLQRAFNALGFTADGEPLEVDGIIGRITMGAVKQTDPSVLAEKYLELYEERLRGLESFAKFGPGWINRVNKLRVFLNDLPEGEGKRPRSLMNIKERNLDIEGDDILRLVLLGATGGKSAVAKALLGTVVKKQLDKRMADKDGVAAELLEALIEEKLGGGDDQPKPTPAAGGKRELTPVNKALGEGIGRALDGKKSVTGIVGLILTAVLPQLGILDQAAIDALQSGDWQTILFTLLSIITGWGFLGKIDKAIREVRETA